MPLADEPYDDRADIREVIAAHARRRWTTSAGLGIKVNLYTELEVVALAAALEADDLAECPVECVMVGDSYFMTHMGRGTTQLATFDEQRWGRRTLAGLVREVRGALTTSFRSERRPFLIADMPDGSMVDRTTVLRTASLMMNAGADVVKLEVPDETALQYVGTLADNGFPVIAHLGYTPQGSPMRRHGDSLHEALALFGMARAVRDAGGCGLVLEMVNEVVNRLLSSNAVRGLPAYSVFSGRAPFGGQSLNIWDAVFRPPFANRYFPPTGRYDATTERHVYTHEVIAERIGALLRLTIAGEFPLSPRCKLDESELAILLAGDPWSGEFAREGALA
jgi:3-methyl-2-oxobutanoate hydroxymethyltransferase